MKLNSLVLAVVLSGSVGSAMAQETFFQSDNSGCQSFMPYSWVELAPGAKWETTVDLSRCASADLGLFLYYGYMASKTSSDVLTNADGIALTVQNLSNREVVSSTAPKGAPVYLSVKADQPAQFRLTAENTGRKACNIRLTWKRVK